MSQSLLVAALAGCALLVPGAAMAREPEAAPSWQRIAGPDGAFTVELPCDDQEIADADNPGSQGRMCSRADVVFGAVLTSDGFGGDADIDGDFDTVLSEAKGDPAVDHVEMLELAGERAFRVWGVAAKPFALVQISERQPGQLIVLAVMADRDGPADTVDRPATEQLAMHFFTSLQVAAQ